MRAEKVKIEKLERDNARLEKRLKQAEDADQDIHDLTSDKVCT